MFCEFGAGIYSGFVLVTCMQSGHVDSTYIVTTWLLEEQESLEETTCPVRDFCDSIKTFMVSHIFCLKYTNLLGI